jgi:poly(3-hydroxybutyrate) depolymerase
MAGTAGTWGMLYQAYQAHIDIMVPVRNWAGTALRTLGQPLSGIADNAVLRNLTAAYDLIARAGLTHARPPFGIDRVAVGNREVAVHEEATLATPFGTLLRFRKDVDTAQPRVLLVAPLSGHFSTLLRGTVRTMLPDHDVYITDWRDAREVTLLQPGFDLDDYIDYVTEFLHLLGPETHVLAVCQPAVPALAAVALMSEREPHRAPRSMTVIGGPIDTREAPTAVNQFAKRHSLAWFRHNTIHPVPPGHPGFMRQVYPGFLQLAGFMAMNLDRHVEAHWQMFLHLVQGDGEPLAAKRRFYDEYRSVMDLSAEFYLQTISTVFQEHLLPRGLLTHRGDLVDPSAIEGTALLTIEGERDDISGLGQTRAAHKLAHRLPGDMREHLEQPGVGHYGLFNGRRFRTSVAPRIKQFILAHR